MNSLLTLLGIESWKPLIGALLLPPVPFFLLLLIGARLILPRRGLGWFVILVSLAGLWLSACAGLGQVLTQFALKAPPAYGADSIAALKAAVKAKEPVAIVVLGGGSETIAPEYGVSNLTPASMERLRYALWLSRETGAPVAFSGGVGWGRQDSQPEAQVAARIASQEFGQPLKWTEDRSRDTRENVLRTVPMIKQAGITRIVVVTHGWHMPRALDLFEQATAGTLKVEAAPMGLARSANTALDWVPTPQGYYKVQRCLHELVARLVRA